MTDSVFNIHIETENGNYEWGASQVLVLLSNYYSNKKLFDENRDGYGNILILKDASIISKSSIIPDLLKGDIVENNNIEYIKYFSVILFIKHSKCRCKYDIKSHQDSW